MDVWVWIVKEQIIFFSRHEIRLRKGMFKIALCKNSQANYTFHMEVELYEYDLNTVIRHMVWKMQNHKH